MEYILLGVANFIFIFLKAFQQRNVAFLHYWAVIPTSALMVIAEMYIIGMVAAAFITRSVDVPLTVALVTGSSLGCIASMWSHAKLFK